MEDSETITFGDRGFRGFASRVNPRSLPEGMLALSENGRIERGEWQTRRGALRVASGISVSDAPISLPFDLAEDQSVSALTRSGGTATATVTAHGWATGRVVEIRGADQAEYNGDFTITVVDPDTVTYTVVGTPDTPATGTILANAGPVVRDSYDGGLQIAGIFRSPAYDSGREWIVLVGSDICYLFAQGESLRTKAYPSGEFILAEDDVTVLQAFDQLFILRSRPLDGDYARKAVTSITQTSGTATVTTTAAHGFTTGDRVRIEGAGQAGYLHEYDITVTDTDEFTVAVPNATVTPATGTITVRLVRKPLVWDGGDTSDFVATVAGVPTQGPTYNALWSTSLATYHNNQLVVAPTPIQDSVQVSQVLDYNIYDPLFKSFRANAGSDDVLVALHSFAEREVLVFGRKSIYRAIVNLNNTGDSFDPATSAIDLITSEIGCAARRTIVTAGASVLFLSDAGVYRLDSQYTDLRLRGTTMPLSDAVQDQLDAINPAAIGSSVAVYADNRYVLAVPTGDATEPNTVLIYNFLNEAWESVDRYAIQLNSLVISTWDNRRRVFAAGRGGSLFVLDVREDGDANAQSDSITPVAARMVTRTWQGPKYGKHRWTRCAASLVMPGSNPSTARLEANARNPDILLDCGTYTYSGAQEDDYEMRRPARVRAHDLSLTVHTSAGRPQVRSVAADVIQNPTGSGRTRDAG